MKPAASLSAKLLVRKGLAMPSDLTRQFALDDPPDLPAALSTAPGRFKTPPVMDTLDGDFYGSVQESQVPEPDSQEHPPVDSRQPDPIPQPDPVQPDKPRSILALKTGGFPLTIIGQDLARRAVEEAATQMPGHNDRVLKPARRPVGSGPRIAMTVRLDHDQHRELHAFADRRGRTSQDVFVRAIETYMAIYR